MNASDLELRARVLLSVQRALIGEVRPEMRYIEVILAQGMVRILVWHEGPSDPGARDDFDASVITQVVADFPDSGAGDPEIDFEFHRCDGPAKPLVTGVLVYGRHEPSHLQPRLVQILIAASPSAAMESLDEVAAIPGQGLAGDRYFTGLGTFSPHPQKPDFELTLIESEQIRDFVNRTGLNFTASDARRNLVTEGMDLNGLVGKEFTIGTVRIRGIRLCEPCNYLAKITHPEVLRRLVHRGGLRAAILTEGMLRRGDPIRV